MCYFEVLSLAAKKVKAMGYCHFGFQAKGIRFRCYLQAEEKATQIFHFEPRPWKVMGEKDPMPIKPDLVK